MIEPKEIEAAIEAALFATPEPIRRNKLLEVFGSRARKEAAAALERVRERYDVSADRGVFIEEVAGGLRLVTRPELHGYLRKLFEITGQNRLSMAALETLAIIAYRQPITGPEIQELRSVNPSGVLKTLLDRRLVRIAGRKMVVGKPFLYATTRDFLMHFGLESLKDLPPLEEFEETFGQMAGPGGDVLPFEAPRGDRSGEPDELEEAEPAAEPEDPDSVAAGEPSNEPAGDESDDE